MSAIEKHPTHFQLHWDADYSLNPKTQLFIRDTTDARSIKIGDEIYIVSIGKIKRLLARLYVKATSHDKFRRRIELTIGGPRSAYFFRNATRGIEVQINRRFENHRHRDVTSVDQATVDVLASVCGTHDFAHNTKSPYWRAIKRRVTTAVARARRSGDTRPDVEIAEEFLRHNFVTSQLPGFYPVYQNAARLALELDNTKTGSTIRRRRRMTEETIRNGVNEDVAMSGQTPDSARHQEILAQLMRRLEELKLIPIYDGYVDCIVELDGFDVYFEVKSATADTVTHQVRTGLGQILHYLWLDSDKTPRPITGHLVVQGPWMSRHEELCHFVGSCSIRLTWSNEIESLQIEDFAPITPD